MLGLYDGYYPTVTSTLETRRIMGNADNRSIC